MALSLVIESNDTYHPSTLSLKGESSVNVTYDKSNAVNIPSESSHIIHTLLSECTISSWSKLPQYRRLFFAVKLILFALSFICFCNSYPEIINNCSSNCNDTIYIFIGVIILIIFADIPSFIKTNKEMAKDERLKYIKDTADSCTVCKFKIGQLMISILWILYGSCLSYLERIILFPNIKIQQVDDNPFNEHVAMIFLCVVIFYVIFIFVLAISCKRTRVLCGYGYQSNKNDICIMLGVYKTYLYIAAACLYIAYFIYMTVTMEDSHRFWNIFEVKWNFEFDGRIMMDISIIASLLQHTVNMFENIIGAIREMDCCDV